MSAMPTHHHLGHGIGLRRQHFPHLLEHGPHEVDWFEIISEDYFVSGGRPWFVLERMRREVPIVAHGVALGIGSTDPLSDDYLRSLRRVIDRIEPAWVSDHLCWGSFGGKYVHDLLPVPLNRASLEHVVCRVNQVQDRLRRAIVLENISTYVSFTSSTMSEPEFLNSLTHRTGCGLLLDVNNVYVCARNHGFDPVAYMDALEPSIVKQIHLAGHTSYGDYIIDTHVGPVPGEVWELYRLSVRRFGAVPTLIEWDEEIPKYEVVVAESHRAAAIERDALAGMQSRTSYSERPAREAAP